MANNNPSSVVQVVENDQNMFGDHIIRDQRLSAFMQVGPREAERQGFAHRFNRRDFISSNAYHLFSMHIFSFLRVLVFIYLIQKVYQTDVKTQASKLEKKWVLETLLAILVFWFILWIAQFVLSLTSMNAREISIKAIVLLFYLLISFFGEMIDHVQQGFYLEAKLPDDDKSYDSDLIHWIRLIILGFASLLAVFLGISVCVLCCVVNGSNRQSNQPNVSNPDFVNRLRKVPYSSLLFEAGLSCPICLTDFRNEEQIVQLKCHAQHVFHVPCLQSWVNSGKSICPLCRKDIQI